MAYSFPEIRQWAGLYKQANSFNVPDGALEEADNIVLQNDNRIAKRRGFYQYYDPNPSTLKGITTYQKRLVVFFTNNSGFLTESGTAPNETASNTNHTGISVAVSASRRVRFSGANKNLYFTTDSGVLKIDSFNGKRFNAGVPPARDLSASFVASAGEIAGNTQVAYRVIYGRRDANDNLLLGSPSDIFILANARQIGVSYAGSLNLATVTSANHNLSTGMEVTVTGASDALADGTFLVTVVDPNTFTYAVSGTPTSGTLTYSAPRAARLEFSLPEEIDVTTDGWFYQIYRSSQSASDTATPRTDFKLIAEESVTSAQIASNIVFYDDFVPDLLLGAELYTNPNSREGELQSNARPPFAEDIELYKNHLLYANVKTRHFVASSIVDTSAISGGDWIEIEQSPVTRRYVAREGLANRTVKAESISGGAPFVITVTGHGLSNGDFIYLSRITGTAPEGEYAISNVTANTFEISPGGTLTDCDTHGVRDSSGNYIFCVDKTSAIEIQIRETAECLVKAINRDPNATFGANYTSGVLGIPGQFRIEGLAIGNQIRLRAISDSVGEAFSPVLTDDFADTVSDNDEQPNVFFTSKISEPEAVPLVNFFQVGSANDSILRIIALRDSAIILKTDGVFKLNGDTVSGFTVTPLDTTVQAINPALVDVINNQIIFLSNQGVCLVTETSVQIISRRIEDVIQPIVGLNSVETTGGAVSYESERLWFLSTRTPGDSEDTTYVYNILNNTWTEWSDILFNEGAVGPNDRLYLIDTNGVVLRERKNQTRIDFCGQNYSATVNSIASDSLSASITVVGRIPLIGDVLVKDSAFSRIKSVTTTGVNTYTVEFVTETNVEVADLVDHYAMYDTIIKLAPFHAGQVGLSKQFGQMILTLRQDLATEFLITYSNSYLFSTDEVEWSTVNLPRIGAQGWGLQPWGLFPWGNIDAIQLRQGTFPSSVIRVYIPRFAQRDTFIQPVIRHRQAGEPIELQALTFAVRAIKERISK